MSRPEQTSNGPGAVLATDEAAALGLALAADAVGAERNPAANVADRASTIRIKSLRATWVNPVVFLRIAASLHVVASIPFFLTHEFYQDNHGFNPKGIGYMPWKLDKDGYIGLPPGPGPGVEIDEKLLEKMGKQP